MRTSLAVLKNIEPMERGAVPRVFDWNKAAALIFKQRPRVARAGLGTDWEWTGGPIYANGSPIMDGYTFLSSNWAVPEIELDGVVQPCFVEDRPETNPGQWGSGTKWPPSALLILENGADP